MLDEIEKKFINKYSKIYNLIKYLMNKLIAITIGDINGIGIDILIKTWKKKKIKNFILFTNIKIFKKYLKKRKIKIKIKYN